MKDGCPTVSGELKLFARNSDSEGIIRRKTLTT